jgi:hypothetical protein
MSNIYTWQREKQVFEELASTKSELIGIEGMNSTKVLRSMTAAMSDLFFYLCRFRLSLPEFWMQN